MRVIDIQDIVIAILKMAGFTEAKSPHMPTHPNTIALDVEPGGVWKKDNLTLHITRMSFPNQNEGMLYARFDQELIEVPNVSWACTVSTSTGLEEEVHPLHSIQCRELENLLSGADIEIGFYRLGYEVGGADHHPAIRYDDKIRVKNLYADSIQEFGVDEHDIDNKFVSLSLWDGTIPDVEEYGEIAENEVKETA